MPSSRKSSVLSVARAVVELLAPRSGRNPAEQTPPGDTTRRASDNGRSAGTYPGDYRGPVRAHYAPDLDGDGDPGEIVWTWVPFEEDASRGKDRPVLVVGRDGPWLLVAMLTSKDHDRDHDQEARWGRHWMDIGAGPWDRAGRRSEIRLDRIIRIDPTKVRREGAIMSRAEFGAVVDQIAAHRGR